MRRVLFSLLFLAALLVPPPAQAQEPQAESDTLLAATVVYIVEETEVEVLGQAQVVQTIELALSRADRRGEIVTLTTGADPTVNPQRYAVGDRVYVRESAGPGGAPLYDVATRDRTFPLALLALVFAALVVLVGRGRGLRSLLALGLSFAIILAYVVPRVASGEAPVMTALVGCGLTLPVSYYLSHGLNRKTSVALAGSLAGLVITGLLTTLAVALVGLTGYSGDEAGFVTGLYGGAINLRALLMAGMMISVLGVLDDVAVAQAATVEQIQDADRTQSRWQLFRRGMAVGQDHISSMVNTLMLVYAGSSLALLLLITNQSLPLGYVLSQEMVAEELVRMLVTSTGLVATVPITTALAAALMGARPASAGSGPTGGRAPPADEAQTL
ncbi:MAG: YibE/F family protein [Anaerolineae bacterium]